MNIGFIGLGNMGTPMARNLLRAGHALTVYNRTRSRAEALGKEGAKVAITPAEAASGTEMLITMLADDAAVETVIFSENGALAALGKDTVHISMSTISPALSKRLAEAHSTAGQKYVAAPVFGGPDAAAGTKLWIIAAGPAEALARCQPIFSVLGQETFEVGEEPEKANVIKLGGNFLMASSIEALGEVFALVSKNGIQPSRFLEIVNGNVLRSPAYERYGTRIIQQGYEPPSFHLRHALKDLRLVLGAAEQAAAPMPMASLIHDQYLSAVARGWADSDWTSLARVSLQNAGLEK